LVDKDDGRTGFFDNMHTRPVTGSEWTPVRIHGRVDYDGNKLNIGFMAFGDARLQVDDVRLTLFTPAKATIDRATRRARIDRLVADVDARRQALDVPGAVLAVVVDGKVERVVSMGQAVPGQATPPDPDAHCLAASVSKPVSATAIATVVAEGLLDWDTPVRSVVPEYHLQDPERADAVTITDLLAHRVGMARMDMPWGTGVRDFAPLLAAQARATPLSGFREELRYDNIGYTVAGMAAARAAGTSWQELMTERVIEPLKMRHSSADPTVCLDDPDLAPGWQADPLGDGWAPADFVDPTVIAPAGGLCTTVPDLARWVGALQRADGGFLGRAELDGMWSPLAGHGTWSTWARGWRVDSWEGERIVHHEGNLPGHGTAIGLLPDDGVGWVLFINEMSSPLLDEVRHLAARDLLPEPDLDPIDPPATGRWPFIQPDLALEVRAEGDGLVARPPGAPEAPLVQTGDGWRVLGTHWWLTSGGEGHSPGLVMRSKGWTIPPGALDAHALPDVEPGVYQGLGQPAVVDEIDGVLAMRVDGETWVRMDQLPEQIVGAIVNGERIHDLPPTPELSTVLRRMHAALGPAPGSKGPVEIRVRMTSPHLGLDDPGQAVFTDARTGSLLTTNPDLGVYGLSWSSDQLFVHPGLVAPKAVTSTEGDRLDHGWLTWLWSDWSEAAASVRVLHRDHRDGTDLVVLRVERPTGDFFDVSVDTRTWLPVARVVTTGAADPRDAQMSMTERFEGWALRDGVMLPGRVVATHPQIGSTTITLAEDVAAR
ncbi:MAG: class A beta-lactamase-related serine hydrolase, partial [Deltaproteobacteria bacterium]